MITLYLLTQHLRCTSWVQIRPKIHRRWKQDGEGYCIYKGIISSRSILRGVTNPERYLSNGREYTKHGVKKEMEEGWLPSPYLTTKPLFSELSHWSRAWIQVKGSKKRCRKQKKNLKFLIAQKHEAIIIQRHLLIWEIVCCPHSFWLLSSFLLFVVLPPFQALKGSGFSISGRVG